MKKLGRILVLILIGGAIVAAMITSTTRKTPLSEKIWNEGMTLGSLEAKNYFIVYTDLMCPYCNLYAQEVYHNEEEFEQYLAENNILYEVRVTDMLYDANGIEFSRVSAEGAYCANREGKFWDYYHTALVSLEEDYYKKGIGNSKTAPRIEDMTRDYWKNIAEKAGIGGNFEACFDNGEALEEIDKNTTKANSVAYGLPSFAFNKYETSGFDPSWDFSIIKELYEAGLKSL